MNDQNVHKGHRSRVREKVSAVGLDGFQPHEVLEYLLFHTVPYKDTNELSHKLINTFGSISGVFDADYEDLMRVDGVSSVTASFLSSLPDVMKIYNEDRNSRICVKSSQNIVDYLRAKFTAEIKEKLYVVCLDSGMKMINCVLVSEGNGNKLTFENRSVAETAIRNQASYIILSHNHPGCSSEPSRDDIDSTYQLKNILSTIDIKLIDHIVFSDDGYTSMAESEKYRYIF